MSETVDYGDSMRGELFRFVHSLCETELEFPSGPVTYVKWTGRLAVGDGMLTIDPVTLSIPRNSENRVFRVLEFSLNLDYGETNLAIYSYNKGDLNDELTVWSKYMLERAQVIY